MVYASLWSLMMRRIDGTRNKVLKPCTLYKIVNKTNSLLFYSYLLFFSLNYYETLISVNNIVCT